MSLTKKKEAQIRKLSKQGLTQQKIGLKLKIRKQTVSTFLQQEKIGKRAPLRGAAEFWQDVKAYKKRFEVGHKEGTKIVRQTSKWRKRRIARLSPKNREFYEFWEMMGREERRAHFRDEEAEKPNIEDYEEYFATI